LEVGEAEEEILDGGLESGAAGSGDDTAHTTTLLRGGRGGAKPFILVFKIPIRAALGRRECVAARHAKRFPGSDSPLKNRIPNPVREGCGRLARDLHVPTGGPQNRVRDPGCRVGLWHPFRMRICQAQDPGGASLVLLDRLHDLSAASRLSPCAEATARKQASRQRCEPGRQPPAAATADRRGRSDRARG